ncbi:hypothetical protein E4U55_007869 [Claviceps digitariae]|nr:hypothetical protein E4U55_007869 [Claviceps digitariae]
MSSNNGGTSPPNTTTEPFVWVLIPLVVVFSIGTFIIFVWNKNLREHFPDHPAPEDIDAAAVGDDVYGRFRRGVRSSTRGAEARSMEGLNELGEAPPPYDAKKPPGIADQHGGAANEPNISGTGPRDTELPPGYPARPLPTHAAISRHEQ